MAETFQFSKEDLLIIRCQDAVKEHWKPHWPQLKWICDIAEIIRVYGDMDWKQVMGQVTRCRTSRVLSLCLALTNDFLGTPLPPEITKQIQKDHLVNSKTSFKNCSPATG
jgi:hypothetical protein